MISACISRLNSFVLFSNAIISLHGSRLSDPLFIENPVVRFLPRRQGDSSVRLQGFPRRPELHSTLSSIPRRSGSSLSVDSSFTLRGNTVNHSPCLPPFQYRARCNCIPQESSAGEPVRPHEGEANHNSLRTSSTRIPEKFRKSGVSGKVGVSHKRKAGEGFEDFESPLNGPGD